MRIKLRSQACLGVLVGLVVVLSGCGGTQYQPVRNNFVEFTREQKLEIEIGAQREYHIQTDDILRIAVAHQKELTQDGVLVLPDGSLGLIGVDRVVVGGLSVSEADSVITSAYSKEYRDPQISVIVLETKGRRVYVLGEVRAPGLQKLPAGGLGVIGAVTLAGGFTADAAPEGAVLVRVTQDGYMVQEMDLNSFHSVESVALATVELQAYDVIYVPRSRIGDFSYFTRSVLSGLVSITRMASDLRYLSSGVTGRF